MQSKVAKLPLEADGKRARGAAGKLVSQETKSAADLSSVLATVVHQMSQPLTALRGTLEIALLKGGSARDFRLAAQKAMAAAERLAKILQSAGELAEACEPREDERLTDLRGLVRDILEDLAAIAESQGVTLRATDFPDIAVCADRERLSSALIKVLNFSLLRTPKLVSVELAVSPQGESVKLTVLDDGESIPPASLGKLFEVPRINSASSAIPLDALWDLAVARKQLEGLGGFITAENRPGKGCRVEIRLPLTHR